MTLNAPKAVAWHALALAILLWPLAGIEFVPMVDLPGHLAITRVLDDVLHGKYRDTLQLNVDPIHKPTYVLLYAVFAVLPKAQVGQVAVGLMIVLCYAAICHSIAALARRGASSPLVVSFACLIGMFCFSSTFFWGLMPFILSMPPALIAYRAYLEASGIVEPRTSPMRHALVFVAAATLAHVVHPLASIFLGIMLAGAAVTAIAFALIRRASFRDAATAVGLPLVVWVVTVGALQLLTAPPSYGDTFARSASALAAPFHGVTAAWTFLTQIPIELNVVPTRERVVTTFSFPVAVALLLAAASVLALVASRVDARARSSTRRLAVVFVVSALLVLFLRHDLLQFGIRALFYPVRAPGFLVFFFAVIAAALILRLLEPSRAFRILPSILVAVALALAMQRSAVLRAHFVAFDAKVHAFFRAEIPDRFFQSQPFSYGDHIRVYNCYYDATCYDLSRLFFSIYADATIYPVSRIPNSRLPKTDVIR